MPGDERHDEERDERGAAAIEYALFLAFVAAVIVAAVLALGLTVFGWFDGFRALFEAALGG